MTSTTSRTYRPAFPIWCAGCGHYGVQSALQAALRQLNAPDHDVVILAGIGCSGTIQNNLGTYGYHAQHGRVLPAATGLALSNPSLTVVAAGGDGDGYAIGVGHLVHAFRRDVSFTYIVMNNETYGLTKGQHSPTRAFEYPSHAEAPLDAVAMGLSIGSTSFVARGYSGWYDQLVRLTTAALLHAREKRGFAFLEVISPCVTYQDSYPRWEHALCDVDADASYDPTDRAAALALTLEVQKRGQLPTGLIYRAPAGARAVYPAPAQSELRSAALTTRYEEIMDGYAVAVDLQ